MRKVAIAILLVVCGGAIVGSFFAPASYETQFRESPNAPPSHKFPLGTDELGRDRLSRMLFGTRISLLLAPAAALIATAIAGAGGAAAALLGGWWERAFLAATDLS